MKKMFAALSFTVMALFSGLCAFAGDVASEAEAAAPAITIPLLLKGMLGIFVVMGLIYLVIIILNKITEKTIVKDEDKNGGK